MFPFVVFRIFLNLCIVEYEGIILCNTNMNHLGKNHKIDANSFIVAVQGFVFILS